MLTALGPTLIEYNHLDAWYRQLLKLSEEEKAILQDEPSDVIKNLVLLTALRSASEAEVPLSRAIANPKSRKICPVAKAATAATFSRTC
jgi:SAGA-associated factor 29